MSGTEKSIKRLVAGSAEEAAPRLLGCELVVIAPDGTRTGGIIVETEAYDQTDEASHTYRGKTRRNAAMFNAGGTVYVYLTYGLHHCLNISAGAKDFGAGVLIRAIEPTIGLETMWRRRFGEPMPPEPPRRTLRQLTNGPGKLTKALGVTLDDNHADAERGERVRIRFARHDLPVTRTTRVGISKAVHAPRRWYLSGSAWVSRP